MQKVYFVEVFNGRIIDSSLLVVGLLTYRPV